MALPNPLRALWRFLRRFEARVLLGVIGVAGALWLFWLIGGVVSAGGADAWDRSVILALREPGNIADPRGSGTLEEAVRDITALGGTTMVILATLTGVLALLFHRLPRHALVLAGAVLAAWLSKESLKAFYDRPRPDLVPHGSFVYSASFPSGHTTLSTATFLTLAMLIASLEERRRSKALVYAIAVFVLVGVGMSRVYLGVHWPSDVLGGWVLGAAWALLAWLALRYLGGRARGV